MHRLLLLLLATFPAAAQSWTLGPFTRPLAAPVISPNPASTFADPMTGHPVAWEALHTFNPAAALAPDGQIAVLYRAEDNSGTMSIGGHTSRLGLATSPDGLHFTREPAPVLFPAPDAQSFREVLGGVEDPRLVQLADGTYVLTYTQYNRQTYTIGIATSPDLRHWTKHGAAFGDTGPYAHLQYKSGGILTEIRDGRIVAARLHGHYWMYWGEIEIRLATSDDCLHWHPVESSPGHPLVLLRARPGHFDSGFPETGPPPLVTPAGIVMLYNAKNAEHEGDPALKPGTYSAGQALFSADEPTHLLARTEKPFLKPEQPYERTGQYAAGTTFAEGLVLSHGTYFLYYGTADSFVGVASAPATSAAAETAPAAQAATDPTRHPAR